MFGPINKVHRYKACRNIALRGEIIAVLAVVVAAKVNEVNPVNGKLHLLKPAAGLHDSVIFWPMVEGIDVWNIDSNMEIPAVDAAHKADKVFACDVGFLPIPEPR